MKNRVYHRGDILLVDLTPSVGSEQSGLRPVVVIQNNIGNRHSSTLIVAALTTRIRKKLKQPTHYLIRKNPALTEPSLVLREQIRTIDKKRIKSFLGRATEQDMQGIEAALLKSLALNCQDVSQNEMKGEQQ